MRKTYVIAIAIAALVVAAFVPATAGAADFKPLKWSNGHKLDSEDGNFKLKFGGRVQADYTFVLSDDGVVAEESRGDGFEFRRARLFFEGTIYKRVIFKAQYDFAGGDADFKDVYVGLTGDWGKVRFGHFKEYFSMQELTSSKYQTFLERALPVTAFAPSRNSGIGADGGSDTFNWGVGAFYETIDTGNSFNEDRLNIGGRVGWRPFYEKGERSLHLGLGATQKNYDGAVARFRTRPEAHYFGRTVDTGNFDADDAFIWNVEVGGAFGAFHFSSEYIQNDVSLAGDANVGGGGDPTFSGYYVDAGWFITGEHRPMNTGFGTWNRVKPGTNFGMDGIGGWEIALRYSTVDLSDGAINGGEQTNYGFALNWYLNPATRMMLDWIHADVDDTAGVGEVRLGGEGDILLWRWQVDF